MCVFQVCCPALTVTRPPSLRREAAAWAQRPRPPTQTPTCPSEDTRNLPEDDNMMINITDWDTDRGFIHRLLTSSRIVFYVSWWPNTCTLDLWHILSWRLSLHTGDRKDSRTELRHREYKVCNLLRKECDAQILEKSVKKVNLNWLCWWHPDDWL